MGRDPAEQTGQELDATRFEEGVPVSFHGAPGALLIDLPKFADSFPCALQRQARAESPKGGSRCRRSRLPSRASLETS